MKKVIGIVKPNIPTSSFVEVLIDMNDSDYYYMQNNSYSKIDFLKIKKENVEIIPTNYSNDKIIGIENILAYLKEDGTCFIGTITEIYSQLIELLNNKNLLAIAKIEICNELKLWGLSKIYLNEAINFFKEKKINIFNTKQLTPRFNETDFFLDNDDDISLSKFIPREIESYKLLINSKNNISWKETFTFRDNGKTVCFGDIDMPPELLFDKALEMGYSELSMKLAEIGSPYRSFLLEKEPIFSNYKEMEIEDTKSLEKIKSIASKIKKINDGKIQ